MFNINHLVCTNSAGTQPYQSTVDWDTLRSKFLETSQGPTVPSGLSKDSSGRRAVFTPFWLELSPEPQAHVFPTSHQTQCPQTHPLPPSCCDYDRSSVSPSSPPILSTGPQMQPLLSTPTTAQGPPKMATTGSPILLDIPPI